MDHTEAMSQLFLGNTDGLNEFKIQDLTERRRRALEMIERASGTVLAVIPHFSIEGDGEYLGETLYYEVDGAHLSSVSTVTHIQSFCAHGEHVDKLLPEKVKKYLLSRRDELRKDAQKKLSQVG